MAEMTQKPFKAVAPGVASNVKPLQGQGVPAKATNPQDAVFGYMRQSSDALRRIENALTKERIMPTASMMTPLSVTATTTAAPITAVIPGARGYPAYFFAVTVSSMGTATKIYLGNSQAQLTELTMPNARAEYFCEGFLVDVSDLYIKTDVGTATVTVTGYMPLKQADSGTSKAVLQ